jgi:Major Facilitator Superfamily
MGCEQGLDEPFRAPAHGGMGSYTACLALDRLLYDGTSRQTRNHNKQKWRSSHIYTTSFGRSLAMIYRRGWIALLLFSLAMINYIDRITLSFAIGPIAKEFALDDVAKGYLFSSFLWTYTLFLIPMGMLVDRYGSKKVAGWGIGIWSIATVLTGMATGIGTLLASRLAMGTGEASSPWRRDQRLSHRSDHREMDAGPDSERFGQPVISGFR